MFPFFGLKFDGSCFIQIFDLEEVLFLAFVSVRENESLENAIKRFRRKVQKEAIMREYKKHSVYLKPGDKRRMKEHRARKRMRRYLRRKKQQELW
jgi:small subunit ribosomal protein S21